MDMTRRTSTTKISILPFTEYIQNPEKDTSLSLILLSLATAMAMVTSARCTWEGPKLATSGAGCSRLIPVKKARRMFWKTRSSFEVYQAKLSTFPESEWNRKTMKLLSPSAINFHLEVLLSLRHGFQL